MVNDSGADDNVLAKLSCGNVAFATVSAVVYVCGVSEYRDCGAELASDYVYFSLISLCIL